MILLVLILFPLFLPSHTTFYTDDALPTLNTTSFQVYKSHDSWKVKFACVSDFGECMFNFRSLPFGWSEEGDLLKVPITDVFSHKEYQFVLIMTDSIWQSKEIDLLLSFRSGSIQVRTLNDFQSSQKTSNAALNIGISEPKAESLRFAPKSGQDLNYLEKNYIVHTVPTVQNLDRIIASGDNYEISKSLQNIISDKSDCSQKLDYLSRIDERLGQHIYYIKKVLSKEEQESSLTKMKIFELTEEQNRIQNSLKDVWYHERIQLENHQRKLERNKVIYFSKHYSLFIVANKYLERLKAYMSNSASEENQKHKLQMEMEESQEQLRIVNTEIEELLEKKKKLEQKILNGKQKMEETQSSELPSDKISALQQKYKQYNKMASEYEGKSEETQSSLKKVKAKLEENKSKVSELEKRLSQIERELIKNKSKEVSEMGKRLASTISVLERNHPKITNAKDKCLAQQYKPEKQILMFQTGKKKVEQKPISKGMPSKEEVMGRMGSSMMQAQNIFSSAWIMEYGAPNTSIFSCKSKKKMEEGYGMIKGIGKGQIRIESEDGGWYVLHLGRCTEVLAEGVDFVPHPGDMVMWSGEQFVRGIVNVHKASIYPQ